MSPASPPDAGQLLQRVLILEGSQGFLDRSAVGGLSAFALQQVERGVTPAARDQLAAAAGLLAEYKTLAPPERKRAVLQALDLLAQQVGDTTKTSPKPKTAPARASARPASGSPRTRVKAAVAVRTANDLDRPVGSIKGMRSAWEDALTRVGVNTVRDLLLYFPRMHYDYADTRSISRLRFGEKTTLVGTIKNVRTGRTPRKISITTATIEDESGAVAVRWFNQPYLVKNLPVGARIAITGEPELHGGFVGFAPRDYELIRKADLVHAGRLVPIYALTKGLYQRSLRSLVRRVLDEYCGALHDYLPQELLVRLGLEGRAQAVYAYHFPDSEENKRAAERRLAFDELLFVQLGLLLRKQEWQEYDPDIPIAVDGTALSAFRDALPFSLTGAQERALHDVVEDLSRPIPMVRLLQGDVGSGKTAVAAGAIAVVVKAGKQAAVMAPTEILAEQHFQTLDRLLGPLGVRVELLTGSTQKRRRADVISGLAGGSIDVLVGTHAVIQEGVMFRSLSLAVTDEQHRFGVEQRSALRRKGLHPHALSMTATPIPRTLAITIYGDLDVTAIDELPPGRVPIITTWVRTVREAHGIVRAEIDRGHQAFVICPVIEDSADTDMRSAIAEHRELQDLVFPDLRVGLLHGRMKPKEKDAVLRDFRLGNYEILVATSVVEVGIDIPNATAMVIRDAHRFGLSQLHQFRGRVGRGGDQAFCILLSSSEGEEAQQRLKALLTTDDGFALAEEDLRLRGPGEFWGTRQSGLPELRVATLGDVRTIDLARTVGKEILAEDPNLSSTRFAALRAEVQRFWHKGADLS